MNRTQRRAADKKRGHAGKDFVLAEARCIAASGPRMRRAREPEITWVDQPMVGQVDPVEFKMIVEALGIDRIHGIIMQQTRELQMKLWWKGDLLVNKRWIEADLVERAYSVMRTTLDGMTMMRLAAAYPTSIFWKGAAA
ncbi:hypothetical protein NZL82_01680 [Sphingomonas sanguinis]|uniref:hypothetical protein n=1 Tax=Sphingomonas sp. LC-1 TaxID=3110957 RepID=UPI0021BB6594|nr:hypothetical protein [Sphingomonas sp. LC-1]MCT8000582.1 hypothetical protein [Sphingomonas sp. LC-1]